MMSKMGRYIYGLHEDQLSRGEYMEIEIQRGIPRPTQRIKLPDYPLQDMTTDPEEAFNTKILATDKKQVSAMRRKITRWGNRQDPVRKFSIQAAKNDPTNPHSELTMWVWRVI
jgi:hypothetical protein|tara:strand:+ start:196 stop:534 length:339 start_codon:yes stop_codon:yes gene_type:complete